MNMTMRTILAALVVAYASGFSITEAANISAVDVISITNRQGVRGYIENNEIDTDRKEEAATERRRDEDNGAAMGDTESDEISFAIQERKARMWRRGPLDLNETATKQFAHLHHMKAGGTSINLLLQCSLKRTRKLLLPNEEPKSKNEKSNSDANRRILVKSSRAPPVLPFADLQECSTNRYNMCINKTDTRGESCRGMINNASVMQFCAPIFQMENFDWLNKADVVTVIRHPVDRVWSMFRFQTKRCFLCNPLKTIYEQLENGTAWDIYRPNCLEQILNHQTTNMLSTDMDSAELEGEWSNERKLEEALHNLRTKITVVGVTDELPKFADMLGHVFPWMATSLNGEFMYNTNTTSRIENCTLQHANASPKNNRCGVNETHWNLTSTPDEETRNIILKYNQMDLVLYEEAKRIFGFQKLALGW